MQKIEIEKVKNGWIVGDCSVADPWTEWRCTTLNEALLRAHNIAEKFNKPKRTETETMLLNALTRIANFATGGQLQQMAAEAIAKADAAKG